MLKLGQAENGKKIIKSTLERKAILGQLKLMLGSTLQEMRWKS